MASIYGLGTREVADAFKEREPFKFTLGMVNLEGQDEQAHTSLGFQ